jgi:hypothetical protein
MTAECELLSRSKLVRMGQAVKFLDTKEVEGGNDADLLSTRLAARLALPFLIASYNPWYLLNNLCRLCSSAPFE